MRRILAMALLAALLSWAALHLRARNADTTGGNDVVLAVRRERPAAPPPKPAPPATPSTPQKAAADQPVPLPLFRPLTPPMAAAPQPGEQFNLVGLVGRGGARTAFLKDQVDGHVWTASARGRVGAWSVAAIGERCVSLRRPGRKLQACLQ